MTLSDWTVVIPVKHTDHGKSRLAVPAAMRVELARAIAVDTIAATAPAVRVVVVTADASVAAWAREFGASVVADPGGGIDKAVAAGMPSSGYRAALLGDLPALRTGDLVAALAQAADVPRAVVADAEGTGSTLVTAAPDVPWTSAFGHDSFARHLAHGFDALDVPESSTLRRDVDTLEQLDAAAALGLGPRTAAAYAACLDDASVR